MRTRKAEEIRMRYQYRRLILVGQKHPTRRRPCASSDRTALITYMPLY